MRQSGFTLVEMVLVITIIAILLVLSAVGLAEVLATARDVRTVTLIRILHEGCEAYRLEDPGRNYPGPGGDNGADSTKVIHRLLGSPRSVARQINILAQEPALVSFHRNWLEGPPPNTDPGASGVRIVDVRQTPLRYHASASGHLTATIQSHPPAECVTLHSAGRDGVFDPAGGTDDIGNWERLGTTY